MASLFTVPLSPSPFSSPNSSQTPSPLLQGRPSLVELDDYLRVNQLDNPIPASGESVEALIRSLMSLRIHIKNSALRAANLSLLEKSGLPGRRITREVGFSNPDMRRSTFQLVSRRFRSFVKDYIPYMNQISPIWRDESGQVIPEASRTQRRYCDQFLLSHNLRTYTLFEVVVPVTPVTERYIRYLRHLLGSKVNSDFSALSINQVRGGAGGDKVTCTRDGTELLFRNYAFKVTSSTAFTQFFYILPEIIKVISTLHRSYVLWSSRTL